MNDVASLVDFAPLVRLALLALTVALLPLAWVWLRQRGADAPRRLAALTTLTLFLTFDLMVFGSFTRLTDSGLGCPDWPGCYGEASPVGAHADIHAAQTAMPTGPVTFTKAWIEMIHRYLAMTVGVMILVMCAASWAGRAKLPHSPWWPTVTLAWVIVQGLFGKYTVTLKLYPAIVTLHLLGGALLLAIAAALAALPLAWWWLRARRAPPRSRIAALTALVAFLTFDLIVFGAFTRLTDSGLGCPDWPGCYASATPAGRKVPIPRKTIETELAKRDGCRVFHPFFEKFGPP